MTHLIRCDICGYEETDAMIFRMSEITLREIMPTKMLDSKKHICSECEKKGKKVKE